MNDIVYLVMSDSPENPRSEPDGSEDEALELPSNASAAHEPPLNIAETALREMLEGGPERDADLADLPTGVFQIVEEMSDDDDRERMERIKAERAKRKADPEAERRREEEVEAAQRQRDAHRDANQRLRGRRPGRS